jgi:hypothetical protein
MRRLPIPLSVTRPPPSITTRREVLTTFAVRRISMVTGSGPQANRITPPRRTARTTAAEVQLALDPSPTTCTSDVDTRLCGSPYSEAADDHVGVAPTAARAVRTATENRSTQRW